MVLKEKHTDQWDRLESPEIKPHVYGQIFDKGAKNIQLGKESLFDKWYWENWKATFKRMKLDYTLSPCTKINSEWIKDPTRLETICCIEENIVTELMELGLREKNLKNLHPRTFSHCF